MCTPMEGGCFPSVLFESLLKYLIGLDVHLLQIQVLFVTELVALQTIHSSQKTFLLKILKGSDDGV
jgi:hypothetical protein